MDPDPGGSAFIWVRGKYTDPEYKMEEKVEFNQQTTKFWDFFRKGGIIFVKSEPKKRS